MGRWGRFCGSIAVLVVLGAGLAAKPVTATNGTRTFFPASGLGAIPDAPEPCTSNVPGTPLDVTFDVSGLTSQITDVAVSFRMEPKHTWRGDLDVRLISAGGYEQVLFSRVGGGGASCGSGSDAAGPYTFTDDASTVWAFYAAANDESIPAGPYRASDLSGFPTSISPTFYNTSGVLLNGTWTLRLTDFGVGDVGTVVDAALTITTDDGPDLIVEEDEAVGAPTHKCRKKSGRTSCAVSNIVIDNIGSEESAVQPAGDPIVVRLYRSEAELAAGAVWGQTTFTDARPVSEDKVLKIKVKKGAPPAEVIVVVDATDEVDELAEWNNQLTLPFTTM